MPLVLADRARLGQEVRPPAGIDFLLTRLAAHEQVFHSRPELARQVGDELERLACQDGFESGPHGALHRASDRQIEVGLLAHGGLHDNSRATKDLVGRMLQRNIENRLGSASGQEQIPQCA
jgi:hypothetical protein